MTDYPASHRALLDAKGFAQFATLAPSGHPQVTAVSFFFDEGDQEVKLSLNETRKKVRNLQRDPRCTLFLLDSENPLRYLEIRGNAELVHDEGKAFAAKAGAKYGQDFTQHDGPGEERFIVTIRPVTVNAVDIGG
ncbi:MAG TPA: PPOX class F420-dependent oxidoreductase [Solirubrobacteraceae bacterium]|nr:PPOX class F420-dependent oxidoreductase [Solirubrobacteraceae bacterium]